MHRVGITAKVSMQLILQHFYNSISSVQYMLTLFGRHRCENRHLYDRHRKHKDKWYGYKRLVCTTVPFGALILLSRWSDRSQVVQCHTLVVVCSWQLGYTFLWVSSYLGLRSPHHHACVHHIFKIICHLPFLFWKHHLPFHTFPCMFRII